MAAAAKFDILVAPKLDIAKFNSDVVSPIKNAFGSAFSSNVRYIDEKELQAAANGFKKIKTEADGADDAIKKAAGDTDKLDKNVDGAASKFSKLGDIGKNALSSASGFLLAGGITGVASAFQTAITTGSEFGAGVAELSAITGVSGAALDNLSEKARQLALEFGGSASGNVTAFKGILSKLGPDIATTPAALESMTRAVNTLSAATGDGAEESMDALTTGLLQFQVPLGDASAAAEVMTSQMNVLAAGAKFGAAEVPQVAAAIKVAGVAASGAKVSFEETNAAIQALAAGGKLGAEAGTSLRNVMSKLGEGRFLPKDVQKELAAAKVDISKLSDTTLPFTDRLRELKKISSDAALTTKLFGAESAAAATILIRSVDAQDQLKQQITGTNTATEQAEVRQKTFAAQMARTQALVSDVAISAFKKIEPLLTGFLSGIGTLATGAISVLGFLADTIEPFAPLLVAAGVGYAFYAISANSTSIILGAAAKAQAALNAVMALNPAVAIAASMLGLVVAIKLVTDAFHESAQEKLEENDAQLKSVDLQKKSNLERQNTIKNNQKLSEEYKKLAANENRSADETKRMNELHTTLNRTYPGLIDSTKSFSDNLSNMQKQAGLSREELRRLEDQYIALDKKGKEIAARSLQLKVDVAIEDAQKKLEEGLVDSGNAFDKTIGKYGDKIGTAITGVDSQTLSSAKKFINGYTSAIKGATTDKELTKIRLDITDQLFKIDPKRLNSQGKVLAEQGIDAIFAAQQAVINSKKTPEVKTDAPIDPAPIVPVAKKEKELKSLRDKINTTLTETNTILGEIDAKAQADARKREENELKTKQAAAVEKIKNEADSIRREKDVIESERTELLNALSQQEAALLQRNEQERKTLLAKFAKEDIDARRLRDAEISKAETDSLKTRIDLLKGTDEITIAERGKLRSQLLEIQNKEELETFVEATQAFKEQQKSILESGLPVAEAIAQLQTARETIASGLLAGNDAVSKSYQEMGRANAQAEADAAREALFEIEKARISAIEDSNLRTRKLAELEAKKRYEDEKALNGANNAANKEAFIRYQEDQFAATNTFLEETDLAYSASNSFKKSLAESFSKTEDSERKKSLLKEKDDLNKSEDDLKKSYQNKEITEEEFIAKLQENADKRKKIEEDIQAARFDIVKRTNEAVISTFKTIENQRIQSAQQASDKFLALTSATGSLQVSIDEKTAAAQKATEEGKFDVAAKYSAERDQLASDFKTADDERLKAQSTAYADFAVAAGAQFFQLAAAGENLGRALVKSALGALKALIPVFVAQITGVQLASPNPANALTFGGAGLAAAAALTIALYGAVSIAESAVAGFWAGGKVRGGKQRIEVNELGEERVINHIATAKNDYDLDQINKNNLTIKDHVLKNRPDIVREISQQAIRNAEQVQLQAIQQIVEFDVQGGDVMLIVTELQNQNTMLSDKIDVLTREIKKGNSKEEDSHEIHEFIFTSEDKSLKVEEKKGWR